MTHTSKPTATAVNINTVKTVNAPGIVSKEQATLLAFSDQGMVYEAFSQDGEKVRISITSRGVEVTVHDANGTLRTRAGGAFDEDTSALAKIAEKFQGQDPAPANIPSADITRHEIPYLGTAPADADHTPRPIGTAPAGADHTTLPFAVVNENGLICGIRIEPGEPTTRLKMTLHSTCELQSSEDNPLTRCTFGAVYSPNPTEEDGVFGKYTPFGSLTYNVRSDLAEKLEVGQAYFVDITKVPS